MLKEYINDFVNSTILSITIHTGEDAEETKDNFVVLQSNHMRCEMPISFLPALLENANDIAAEIKSNIREDFNEVLSNGHLNEVLVGGFVAKYWFPDGRFLAYNQAGEGQWINNTDYTNMSSTVVGASSSIDSEGNS